MCRKIYLTTKTLKKFYPRSIQSDTTAILTQCTHVQGSLSVSFSLSSFLQQHTALSPNWSPRRRYQTVRRSHIVKSSYRGKVYPQMEIRFGEKNYRHYIVSFEHF